MAYDSAYFKAYNIANSERLRLYKKDRYNKHRNEFFLGRCCAICGSVERLELDHIDPATKVSNNVWLWSEARRIVELAKCQVLCHDCHLAKTRNNKEYGIRPRGEKQGSSVLTETQVLEIRSKAGTKLHRELASEYSVGRTTISAILSRKTWGHI